MKQKRVIKLILMTVLLVLVFSAFGKTDTQAASKAKYSYKKVDYSKKYRSVKAHVSYKKPVLKGKSSAIKKINKAIKKDCNKFLKQKNDLYFYAKNDAEYGRKADYYLEAKSKVTYNKKGIISIRVTTYWFAGGVSNTGEYGLVYSLKTGKRLKLTDVCKDSSKKIKARVLKKISKDPDAKTYDWDYINSYKVKKMNYYLSKTGKKAVICFEPYELGWGGWSRTYKINR